VNGQPALRLIAAAAFAAALGPSLPGAQESSTVLSPQALKEIVQVEAEIDRIEAQTIERLATPPDNQVQQVELLGKLMLKLVLIDEGPAGDPRICTRNGRPNGQHATPARHISRLCGAHHSESA
jgi:hypothetical protein